MKRFERIMPSPAMAVALTALFVALGGTGYATVAISARDGASAAKKKPSQASRELALIKAYLKSHSRPQGTSRERGGERDECDERRPRGECGQRHHRGQRHERASRGERRYRDERRRRAADRRRGGRPFGQLSQPRLAPLPAIQPITTFVHGWGNAGIPDSPAGYYKDPFGIVHLTGAISGGTVGQVAFVLPPGYIVLGNFAAASTNGSNKSEGPCVLALENAAGEEIVDTGCNNTLVSLEGITYRPTF